MQKSRRLLTYIRLSDKLQKLFIIHYNHCRISESSSTYWHKLRRFLTVWALCFTGTIGEKVRTWWCTPCLTSAGSSPRDFIVTCWSIWDQLPMKKYVHKWGIPRLVSNIIWGSKPCTVLSQSHRFKLLILAFQMDLDIIQDTFKIRCRDL